MAKTRIYRVERDLVEVTRQVFYIRSTEEDADQDGLSYDNVVYHNTDEDESFPYEDGCKDNATVTPARLPRNKEHFVERSFVEEEGFSCADVGRAVCAKLGMTNAEHVLGLLCQAAGWLHVQDDNKKWHVGLPGQVVVELVVNS